MAIDLSAIRRNVEMQPPRIMLYGPHGLGKTTFGAGAPAPIIIQTEDGLGALDVPHFPLAESYQAVIDALAALNADHEYSTVVIDSLDWLDNLIWQDINKLHDEKALAYGKGAVIAADYWRTILDALNRLRARGMISILIAHCEIKRFDSPETDPYERYQPKLQARSSALVQEWCDAVFFANYKTLIKQAEVGFNNKVSRGISNGERLIYTQERPAHLAKNRYNLPETLPLEWEAVQSAMVAARAV